MARFAQQMTLNRTVIVITRWGEQGLTMLFHSPRSGPMRCGNGWTRKRGKTKRPFWHTLMVKVMWESQALSQP
jgi:hypothetical protein